VKEHPLKNFNIQGNSLNNGDVLILTREINDIARV